jgi:hypothetical protein
MANLRALALNAGVYQEIQDTDVLETGLINVADGSAAAPSLSFQNDTDMGFYFISAGNLGVSISGSESYRFQAAAFRGVNSGTFRMPPTAGSESDPTYAFYGDPDTGIYSDSADVLKFSTGGTLRVSMDSTSVTADVPFYALDGTSGSPSFSFQSQSNTGFYYRGANQVGYSSNGTARWYADSNLIASETATGARIRMSAGAVGAPTYSFDGDSDTGLFSDTANTLQFAVGGTERLTLNPNGKLTYTAAATEAPLNVTEQSAEPSTNVATQDVYLDDGTNTSSGNPGWRRYNGAGWEDIAASTGLWTDGGGFAYLTETGDSAVIGDSALTGTEKLKVDGGDILLEGGNINIPDSQVAGGNVGVLESNSTPLLRRHGLAGTLYLGNSGNLARTGPSSSVIVGEGAATSLSNSLSASVIIGYDAGQTAGTGVSGGACVIIGYQAAQNVNDVRSSVVIGSNAAQSAGSSFGSNVAIGAGAGYSAASTINNTVYIGALAAFAGGGQQTVIIGGSACSNATAANWGVYLGYNVADNLTTSYYNVAIGRAALSGLTSAVGTGGENVSIGYQSMASSAGGTAGSAIRNVAIGIDAMYRFYGASHYNVAVGWSALSRTSSSDSGSSAVEGTVALGTLAGYSAYDASYSIYIGYNAGRTNHDDYRLYVHSSTSDVGTAALLYGAFDDRELTVNGQLTAYDTTSYTGTTSSVGVTSQLNYSSTSKKAAWYGFHVDADHAGTSGSSGGDAGNYKGVYSDFAFTAATLVTVDSLYAFDSTLDLGANVTISEYRGLSVGSPTGAGTCDKAYGVYIEAQSGSGQVLGLYVDDDAEITGKLTVGGLIDPTGLVLDEQSTVPGGAPGLAKGTVWVRDDTPNVLVFTDDAGTDWDLNVNSSPWTQDTGFIYLTTTTDNVAIGSTTLSGAANEHLYLLDTVEDSLSTGMYVVLEKDEADVKPAWNGVYVQADHTGGSGVAGGYTLFTADLNWNAAQTLNAGYGYQSRVDVSSGGTISTYFGFQAGNVTGAGTIGTSYGLFVEDMGLSSTNAYGIYVQAQTASGTALGLYVDDDAEITGKLTVGGAAEITGKLTVDDDAEITGKLTVDGLIDPTGLVLEEQGSTPGGAPSAGTGTIWIQNSTPQTLTFTDETDTEYRVINWTKAGTVLSPFTSGDTITVGDGDASAPGLSFEGDTDAGFYSDTGTIGVSIGGSQVAAFGLLSNFALLSDGSNASLYYLRSDNHGSGQLVTRQLFYGQNSTPASVLYGALDVRAVDATSTSEDGRFEFTTLEGGTGSTEQLSIGNGVVVGDWTTTAAQGSGNLSVENDIYISSGTAAAPSVRFISDADTGIYRDTGSTAYNAIGFSAQGSLRALISEAEVYTTVPLRIPYGSAATPAIHWASDTDTGLYGASGAVYVSVAGSLSQEFRSGETRIRRDGAQTYFRTYREDAHGSGVLIYEEEFYGQNSAAANHQFAERQILCLDNTSGSEDGAIYYATLVGGSFQIQHQIGDGVVIGDTSSASRFKGNGSLYVEADVYASDGAEGTPSYTFWADTDTGMYRSATGLSFSLGGNRQGYFNSNGLSVDNRLGIGTAPPTSLSGAVDISYASGNASSVGIELSTTTSAAAAASIARAFRINRTVAHSLSQSYGVVVSAVTYTVAPSTTSCGLYIGSQYNAATTNCWGIYQQSTLDKNILAGDTRVGSTTAPSYPLDVTGDINYSGFFRKSGTRITSWSSPPMTGTGSYTQRNTGTVTLAQLAQTVKQLMDNLVTLGIIS